MNAHHCSLISIHFPWFSMSWIFKDLNWISLIFMTFIDFDWFAMIAHRRWDMWRGAAAASTASTASASKPRWRILVKFAPRGAQGQGHMMHFGEICCPRGTLEYLREHIIVSCPGLIGHPMRSFETLYRSNWSSRWDLHDEMGPRIQIQHQMVDYDETMNK